ncbi:hypothetical protein SynA1825c_02762 [Synechococcus sp. A18-25c]|nr:hypothetical protein SynA1825c_02762 [Synechococcus sp. A18-25c]
MFLRQRTVTLALVHHKANGRAGALFAARRRGVDARAGGGAVVAQPA